MGHYIDRCIMTCCFVGRVKHLSDIGILKVKGQIGSYMYYVHEVHIKLRTIENAYSIKAHQ